MAVTVARASGSSHQTSSEPACGPGVAPGVGVGVGEGVGLGVRSGGASCRERGVGLGVGAALCKIREMTAFVELPAASNTVAVSGCVPFANLGLSIRHCVPSAGVVSVWRAVESILNATRETLPEVFV